MITHQIESDHIIPRRMEKSLAEIYVEIYRECGGIGSPPPIDVIKSEADDDLKSSLDRIDGSMFDREVNMLTS